MAGNSIVTPLVQPFRSAAVTDYDLALGISSGALDSGLTSLHGTHRAVFKGTYGPQTVDDIEYSFSWDFLEPPGLILAKPDDALWNTMIKAQGVTDLPDSGVLQVHDTRLQMNGTIAGAALPQLVVEIKVAVQAEVVSEAITVVPLGVWLSDIPDKYTRILIDKVIVPNLLDQAKSWVSGVKLPAEELFGQQVTVTPVLLDVTGTHLVLAATAGDKGGTGEGAADWPTGKDVFLLVGRTLLANLLQAAVDKWKDTQLADDSKSVAAVAKVWWEAKFYKADNVSVGQSDPTSVSASFDIPWSVGLNLFGTKDKGCALFKASHES